MRKFQRIHQAAVEKNKVKDDLSGDRKRERGIGMGD